ncbi:hypothetical protein BDW60DRAFT_160598 [Aspergillus nidulans var. acristatus]
MALKDDDRRGMRAPPELRRRNSLKAESRGQVPISYFRIKWAGRPDIVRCNAVCRRSATSGTWSDGQMTTNMQSINFRECCDGICRRTDACFFSSNPGLSAAREDHSAVTPQPWIQGRGLIRGPEEVEKNCLGCSAILKPGTQGWTSGCLDLQSSPGSCGVDLTSNHKQSPATSSPWPPSLIWPTVPVEI